MKNLLRKLAIKKILSTSDASDYSQNYVSSLFYKVGTQLVYDKEFPLQINLELSRACNYDCPFCARSESTQGNHIENSVAFKVVDEATSQHKPTLFALHMWGEPLLNPRFQEVISYIHSQKVEHFSTLTTNGFLLTEKNIKKIIDSRLNQIIISLHTFDPEEYIHRVGKKVDLRKLEDNIVNLLKSKQLQKSKLSVVIRLFDSMEKIAQYQEKVDEYKSLGAEFEYDYYDNSAGDRKEWSFVKKSNRWPCYHPFLTLTTSYNADVSVCCVDSRMKLKVGNSKDQSINEIWKSQSVLKMRSEHMNNSYSDLCEICKGCDTWATKPNFFFDFQLKNKR